MRLTILFLIITTITVFGQDTPLNQVIKDPTPENFKKFYNIEEPTNKEIEAMISIGINYAFTNKDTALLLCEKAIIQSEKFGKKRIQAQALLQLGYVYGQFGDLNKADSLMSKAKVMYEKLDYPSSIANANNKLGVIKTNQGKNEEAIEHFIVALEIWENLKDTQSIFMPCLNITWIYYRIEQMDKSFEYIEKAEKWVDILQNDYATLSFRSLRATLYSGMVGKYTNQLAKDTANVALKDTIDNFIILGLDDYLATLELARKNKNQFAEVEALVGILEFKTSQKKYKEALEYGHAAEKLANELGGTNMIINTQLNLAKAYFYLGKNNQALKYGQACLTKATNDGQGWEKSIGLVNEILSKAHQKAGNYQKALEHFKAYQLYQNKINDADKNKAITEVEEKYQNVQKQKKILELEQTNANIARQRNYIIGGILFLGILGFILFQFRKVRKERNDKRAFAEALIFAQEEERKRIARDLHDGIGQSLLLLKKQMIATHQVTVENQTMISNTLDEVRSISRDLHPLQLEKFGLTAAIEDTLRKVERSTDLFITSEMINIDGSFDNKANIHVYRAVQEALSNIVKHAHATAARVTIEKINQSIILTILDNGKGFDHELAVVTSKSLGLRTMYERLSAIGGEMKVEANQPSGSKVIFKIPTSY